MDRKINWYGSIFHSGSYFAIFVTVKYYLVQ